MKRRLISILLCAALLLTTVPCLTAFADNSEINYRRIVEDMVNYFKGKEGDYSSVNRCDSNGCCSIGILQWNGVRALRLLKRVVGLNSADAKEILGSALYSEVVNSSENAWKGRSLSVDEGNRVSKVLDTSYGHQAQDDQAYEDISGYADHGYRLGVRTDPALEYFCDIENQYGSGGCESVVNKVKQVLGGVSTINSLDQFHNAILSYDHPYKSRRTATYNYIKQTLGYDTTGRLVTLPGKEVPINPADVCIGCPGEMFTDMPGKTNWAHTGIEYVLVAGLFCGTSPTTFSPDMHMSRAMLVQVLYNLSMSSPIEGQDAVSGSFLDVAPGKWYEKPILWAAGRGIVCGVAEGEFDPDSDVTREQIAVILSRYSELSGYDMSEDADLSKFTDADAVSEFAQEAMRWAVARGLISGESNKGVTRLNPKGAATRAQVACIIMRFATEIMTMTAQ